MIYLALIFLWVILTIVKRILKPRVIPRMCDRDIEVTTNVVFVVLVICLYELFIGGMTLIELGTYAFDEVANLFFAFTIAILLFLDFVFIYRVQVFIFVIVTAFLVVVIGNIFGPTFEKINKKFE